MPRFLASGTHANAGRVRRFHRPLVLEPLESRLVLTGTWTTGAAFLLGTSGLTLATLLTDGTVMAQGRDFDSQGHETNRTWFRLTPDASGSYIRGSWSNLASMNLSHLYFASNVLPDGRVFVEGGEYSGPIGQQNWTNAGEIYDPGANAWSNIQTFPNAQFGDDPSELLPDGRVLAGYLLGPQTYIYDPQANSWSFAANKLYNDNSDEETWVKLPDDSILSYNVCVNSPAGCTNLRAQRYLPTTNTWVDAGSLPVALTSPSVGYELGPALRLPDGRVFFIGANGHTAYYTPASNTWTAGPDIPNNLGADDAPAALLPNGKILLAADPAHPVFGGPTTIFEFDPTTNTYTNVTPNNFFLQYGAFATRMLVLPTGQVMLLNGGTQFDVYTPDGASNPSWQPTITGITDNGDGTFQLTGTQLNGLSEGASYGDDDEMSSNYPIVQLTDSQGHVSYARTFNWSSTGVATGNTPETTQFTPPAGVGNGVYTIRVMANGIASAGFPYQFPGATHLQVTAAVDGVDTVTPVTLTVTALNGRGTSAPSYRGTVHFTSSDPNAMLPPDYTFIAADAGTHTFSVTLITPGSQSITATDTATGTITGTATAFHEFSSLTGDAVNAVTGPDGNLWFTEGSTNKIGQMSPAGSLLHEFAVTTANSAPAGITAGPDGNLWFTEDTGNKISRITPAGVVTEFAIPTANSRPDFITAGPDSNLWFTETAGNKVGRITPAGVVTEFALPNADSQPLAITAGPGGNLWFTETVGNRIGRISPAGVVTEFAVPRRDSYPFGIAEGGDGNLWFTESVGDNLGRITPAGVVTEFPLATANTGANYLTADRNGNLWFDEEYHNAIGLWSIATGSLTEYAVPTASILQGITVGPDGNIWFGESGALQIGRIQSTITVTPAPLDHFDLSVTGANPAVAGAPFSLTIIARDRLGHTVTNYQGQVVIDTDCPYHALALGYIFGTRDAGMVTLDGQKMFAAGNWTITVTDRANGIQGSVPVSVIGAVAFYFQLAAPANVVSGTAFDVTVRALDMYNNIATSYQGTVHFTTSDNDPGVVLPADYTFQASDAGVVTFAGGATLITAGPQTITVTDTTQALSGQAGVTVSTPRGHHHRWPVQLTQAQAVDLVLLAEGQRREPGWAGVI